MTDRNIATATREARAIAQDAERLRRSLKSLVLEAQDALTALDEGKVPQSLDFAIFGQTIWKDIPQASYSLYTRLTSATALNDELVRRALSETDKYGNSIWLTEEAVTEALDEKEEAR